MATITVMIITIRMATTTLAMTATNTRITSMMAMRIRTTMTEFRAARRARRRELAFIAVAWTGAACSDGADGQHLISSAAPHPLPPAVASGPPVDPDLSDRCISPAGTSWDPQYDSCWKQVAWPAPCKMYVAKTPEAAVPALEWQPCEWGAGCQRMKVNWNPPAALGRPILVPSVVRAADGYRVGMMLALKERPNHTPIFRASLYDGGGRPIAAWTTDPADETCVPVSPIPGHDRVWFGATNVSDNDRRAAYVVANYADAAIADKTISVEAIEQTARANDDTLALWLTSGVHAVMYDGVSGVQLSAGGAMTPFRQFTPTGRYALGVCSPTSLSPPAGCMWNGYTASMYPVVAPANLAVPRIDTDGATFVWVQAGTNQDLDNGTFPDPWIYTSPYAIDEAAVVATKRRPAPPYGYEMGAAGEGYWVTTALDWQYHIYRLSDAHHWAYPCAQLQPYIGQCLAPLLIDGNEMWLQGSHSIVRQRIDALGPGD